MDTEIPILSGYLNVPTQSGFSLNRISKKRSSQRYCLLFKASRHGIERLEICESKKDKNPKIITLENCVKITQEPSTNFQIQIVKKTGTLTLNALSEEDLKEWITALQTVAFRDKGGGSINTLGGRNSTTIEEDNDLYYSSYGDGLFIVKLIPSDTSVKCNFEPKNYMLHLTTTDIQLKSDEDLNIIVAKWPYKFIRKYGYSDGKFIFEAGRKCKTGEGVFTFYHSNAVEVFRCMSSKTKSMKKLLSGDSLNSLDCGDNQLSAALSMGAGSRSPIPPSPNQSTNDFELSTSSLAHLLSSNDSLNNVSIGVNSVIKHIPNKPPRKLLNNERPSATAHVSPVTSIESKLLLPLPLSSSTSPSSSNNLTAQQQQSCDKFKKFQNYEPVAITTADSINSTVILKGLNNSIDDHLQTPPNLPSRYDLEKTTADKDYESIENITEAWKTLGLSDVKHIEHITTPDDDLIDFVWQRTQSQRENGNRSNNENSSTINQNNNNINNTNSNNKFKRHDLDSESIISESNYDRLDFLSPNNKITSSGYKTIVTLNPSNSSKKNFIGNNSKTINDYELIANPDIQPCRVADDSYLGYGVLRKPSLPGPQVPTPTSIKNLTSKNISSDETALDHRNYNGINYAIVSKPKRV